MTARPPMLLAVFLAIAAAGCGSSTTTPSSTNAQTGSCQLVGGKVQVVILYKRDPAKVSAAFVSFVPTVALSDRGDPTTTVSTNPQMTRIDDYTWTVTVLVVPNADVMSHAATVIDLGLQFAGNSTPCAVTGVTANGVQLRKVTAPPLPPLGISVDIGYFGVDACGNASA